VTESCKGPIGLFKSNTKTPVCRPLQKDHESVNIRWSSIRYPVCSGPKQFAAYLNGIVKTLIQ
jgi:hypothetical protein